MTNDFNPKTRIGATKLSISNVPIRAIAQCAVVMDKGAEKYGPFNWRSEKISKTTYVNAILRHLYAWIDGQEIDPDSGALHIAAVMANCALVIDAQSCGQYIDDMVEFPSVNRMGIKYIIEDFKKGNEKWPSEEQITSEEFSQPLREIQSKLTTNKNAKSLSNMQQLTLSQNLSSSISIINLSQNPLQLGVVSTVPLTALNPSQDNLEDTMS